MFIYPSLRNAVAVCLLFCLPLPTFGSQMQVADPYLESRKRYKEAVTALERGRTSHFKSLKTTLKDYPLYPYLEYSYLLKRMRWLPEQQVSEFLEQYTETPLAPRLRHQWLRTLARHNRWQQYLNYFDDNIRSAELRCYALWAEHKAGHTQAALSQVQTLWLVDYSQPEACDPIFKLWRDNGYLTDELAWQRFSMAMKARKTQLARYLIRFMSPHQQKLAKLYRELHFYPNRLKNKSNLFATLSPQHEEVLLHGLQRLTRRDVELAQKLWDNYQSQHAFSPLQNRRINRQLILGYAGNNLEQDYLDALTGYAYPDDANLVEKGIEMGIRAQNWKQVKARIEKLAEPSRKTERWQYWYARALQELGIESDTLNSRSIYRQLAQSRSYYGFLAADLLNTDYNLNQQSYAVDGNFLELFKRSPGIVRARELLLVGDNINARREWYSACRHLDNVQHYSAAHYAYNLGWYSQAIKSAIAAERWHDLKLRFPLAHRKILSDAAENRQIDQNWLFAVARQESAMTPDARSPKGALGLLQMLPSTAKMVARKNGIRYKSSFELLDPAKNASLSSAYLKQLLGQFDQNLVYATAAYNAGPHRVKTWLRRTGQMPPDIWIEQIPFSETRQYVKNVLAYSVIFATLRGDTDFRMATQPYMLNQTTTLAKVSGE